MSPLATRRLAHFVLLGSLVLGLVGCDHATKRVARDRLASGPPRVVVPDRLELRYVENRGTAFSLERWAPAGPTRWGLRVGRTLALLALLLFWWWRRREATVPEDVALAVALAGAAGNTVEYLVAGRVVDFIHLHGWPVFNLADVYLAAGGALIALVEWRRRAPGPSS
jgi:signal peptidase II